MYTLKENSITNLSMSILMILILNGCAKNPSMPKKLFSFKYDYSLSHRDIVLIIPGMNQSNTDQGYDSIGEYYKRIGVTPVYVNIDWKIVGIGRLSAAALQINEFLNDSFPDSHLYLFGFSFGAVISLKLSQLKHMENILLCSMSPLFSEDRVHQIFPFKQLLGLITDYSTNGLSYSTCQGTCVHFLYGDLDSFVINEAIITARKMFFKCNETIIVVNARHNISSPQYLKAIKQTIARIAK